jgi:multidrug efflux system membrane fusion protein
VESTRLQVTYSEVRSPLNGRIGRILVDRGNIVKPNETSMAVVNQIRPIYVAFSVPQQELAEVRRRAGEGSLTVDVSPGADGTQPISGRLSFIDNQVDSGTGTLLLKGEFANEDEALWPGQFVDTLITLEVLRDAVVVPFAAVQTGQQGEYVYTIAAGDSVELRPVRTGEHVGGEVVIKDGLRAGERVVTDGQLQLAPGSHVEVKGDDAGPRVTPPAPAG